MYIYRFFIPFYILQDFYDISFHIVIFLYVYRKLFYVHAFLYIDFII